MFVSLTELSVYRLAVISGHYSVCFNRTDGSDGDGETITQTFYQLGEEGQEEICRSYR